MSSYCLKILLPLHVLSVIPSLVQGQTFLETEDGTKLSLGVPETLSKKCQATFDEAVQCSAGLGGIAFDGAFPTSDRLASICTDDCYKSLNAFRSRQNETCSKETFKLDGMNAPATYNVDLLLFTYNYICLRDGKSKDFCTPLINKWSDEADGPTSKQYCSECMLRTFQAELNSPFGYDQEFADYYTSLTSSCQATNYPFISPEAYFVDETTTATPTRDTIPSASCESKYTVKQGDDCDKIAKAKSVSPAMLQFLNSIAADCSNFPKAGTELCLPETCDLYTLQKKDTCWDIVQTYNSTFSMTQLISWNPSINRDCSNIEALEGILICISPPGDSNKPQETTVVPTTAAPTAIPSNIVDGTNTRCAKYYEIAAGDTCSSVTVMMGISLEDFFFLNPEINKPNCTNLLLGYSYCVKAVGSIETYSGYGGDVDNCFMNFPVPNSCYATSVKTVPGTWTFPSRTTQPPIWTELPLAPGTPSGCAEYAPYIDLPPRRGKPSVVNRCLVVANVFGENVTDFVSLNPSLSYDDKEPTECELKKGYRYCIRKTPRSRATSLSSRTTTGSGTSVVASTEASQSQASASMTTSTGSNGVPTPLPIQDGMASDCIEFYLVKGGDGCYNIASGHKTDLSDFYKWNPAVKDDCSGLYPKNYVCVGIGRGATSTKQPAKTQSTETGATPSPTQDGMTGKCNKFYMVKKDDSCYNIAEDNGVALKQLYSWNPALEGDCSGLYPNYYICVGVGR